MMALREGQSLPTVRTGPITPVQVAFMIVANNDTAAIHVDEQAARKAGLPRPVAPGSFVLGHLGQMLERVAGLGAVRSLDVRFHAAVFTGDALVLGGTVMTIEDGDAPAALIDLWVKGGDDKLVATGTARISPAGGAM